MPTRISTNVVALVCAVLVLGQARAARPDWRILALRVDFRPEEPDEPSTTGTGQFDLRSHEDAMADYDLPFDTPPHDREYFQVHLQALARYYDTVSGGRVAIDYAVYPRENTTAYTLPQSMLQYGNGRTEAGIGARWIALLRDAIAAAEADPQGPDFAAFNSFLVFHAGVGYETGRINDIRSVFLTPADMAAYAGGPLTAGESVREIHSAWILPETPSYTGRAGLNGLLAKFFGHQLGLPGLSNFADGMPAVGGWSLMDVGANRLNFVRRHRPGASDSLVAGVGFVPPHPLAWSKARLGWLEPVTVQRSTTVPLLATDRTGSHPKAVRIPLNHDQYLLLENRQRRGHVGAPPDVATPYADAAGITWLENKQIDFSRPDSSGVWLGVEEYDAFVPGSGVLVWDVNAGIVDSLFEAGSINDDPVHPGIALIEADGYRDIGRAAFERLDRIEGSPEDPFHAGGQAGLGAAGGPPLRTDQGWDSGVEIQVLDEPGDVMRVRIHFPRQVNGWPVQVTDGRRLHAADVDGDGAEEWIVCTLAGVEVRSSDGGIVRFLPGARFLAAGPVEEHSGAALFVSDGRAVEAWTADGDSPRWQVRATAAPAAGVLATLASEAGARVLALALEGADSVSAGLELLDADTGEQLGVYQNMGAALAAADWRAGGGALLTDGRNVLTADGPEQQWEVPEPGPLHPVGGDLDGDGAAELIRVDDSGTVWLYGWEAEPRVLARLEKVPVAAPVLGDVDGDGWLEIVLACPQSIHVLRADGIRQAGFPARLPRYADLSPLTHAPVLVDVDADGRQEILIGSDRGVLALDDTGAFLAGFALLTARPVVAGPVAADADGDGSLEVAALTDSAAYVWTPVAVSPHFNGTQADWGQAGGNAAGTYAHVRTAGLPAPDPAVGVLVSGSAYCHPNPVGREGTAHVRFTLNRSAVVRLSVFDAVGQHVDQLAAGQLHGPAEHELSWPVTAYDSGLYLCRLRARGVAGGKDEAVIKMAVKR